MQGEGRHRALEGFNPRRQGEWGIVPLVKYEGHTFSHLFNNILHSLCQTLLPGHWDPEMNTAVPAFQEITV